MTSSNRRTFLKGSLTATAALMASASCSTTTTDRDSETGSEKAGGPSVPSFELDEMSIADLGEAMESGRFTARAITEMYLERIEALNTEGPALYAVLETNPDALAIAEELDREAAEGRRRGPLHGIPLLLKDNVDTADKMTTTAGSTALTGSIPPTDATIASKLRAAGAILLGKANMSEWAGWKSFERGTSGWSGRGWNGGKGGFCKNPYVLDRTPGGSSSGSGSGAAACLAAATIGTETDGSITGPSSRNNLVGIKPTIGLWSRGGIIPIAHSQDSAGPMARSVRDAVLILGVATGVDPRDPLTAPSEGRFQTDYTSALDPNGLAGARIGVARDYAGFDDRVDKLFDEALDVMKQQGATIVDPITLPSELRFGNEYEMEVLYHEFKADLNAYLASLGPDAPIRTLEELIAYNESHAELELSLFGQELLTGSQERGPLTDRKYIDALAMSHRLSRDEGIDRVMDAENLQAIVGPTSGIAAPLDPLGSSRATGGGCSTPPAMAGYPNLSVPMGFLFGVPVGMSMFGRAWSEATLVKLAYAYEQAAQHRRPPQFFATVPL